MVQACMWYGAVHVVSGVSGVTAFGRIQRPHHDLGQVTSACCIWVHSVNLHHGACQTDCNEFSALNVHKFSVAIKSFVLGHAKHPQINISDSGHVDLVVAISRMYKWMIVPMPQDLRSFPPSWKMIRFVLWPSACICLMH